VRHWERNANVSLVRKPEDKRPLEGPGDMQDDRTKKILPSKMMWPGQEAAVGSVGCGLCGLWALWVVGSVGCGLCGLWTLWVLLTAVMKRRESCHQMRISQPLYNAARPWRSLKPEL